METSGFFRTTSLLHMALLSGQLIMLAVMFFLIKSFEISTSVSEDIFLIIVPVIALSAYFLGNKFYTSRIAGIDQEDSVEEKLTKYRAAFIVRLALLEGSALMAIMIYFITSNFLYMLVAVLLLVYFYTLKPTLTTIQRDAKLSAGEAELL